MGSKKLILPTLGCGVFAVVIVWAAFSAYADPACPPEGASGCHCARPACGDGEGDPCKSGWCNTNGDCWGDGDTDGYWFELEEVETCIAEAPTEDGGCDNAVTASPCRVKNFCDCDWNFRCGNEFQSTENEYFECFAI